MGVFLLELFEILPFLNNYKRTFLLYLTNTKNFLFRVNLFLSHLSLKSYFSRSKNSKHPTLGKISHYMLNHQSFLRFFYFKAWSAVIQEYKRCFDFTAWSADILKCQKCGENLFKDIWVFFFLFFDLIKFSSEI